MPDSVEETEVLDVDVADEGDGPDLESFLDAELPEADEPEAQDAPAAEPAPTPPPPVTPPAPPAQPEDPRLAEGLAAIMRESRELQDLRRQLEEERSKLEPLRKYERLQTMLEEEDAEGALRELGLDLETAARASIEGRGTKPLGRLQKQLEDKLAEIQQQADERIARVEQVERERAHREAVAEVQAQIVPEKYPLAAAVQDLSTQAIFQKAQEHFKRSGKVPSYDQVIGEVETELASFVDRLMSVDAVRQKYASKAQTSAKTPSPTLTNQAASQVSKRKAPKTTQELPADRDDAIEAILAELA